MNLVQCIDLGDEELEDEIYYSIDPMDTINKEPRKENIEMISLACISPMTEEIRERIEELKEQIKYYGVSGIFTYFFKLCHDSISDSMFSIFPTDLIK